MANRQTRLASAYDGDIEARARRVRLLPVFRTLPASAVGTIPRVHAYNPFLIPLKCDL
jgi:hypothetical protein